jgi:hypothetical protein
MQMVTVQFTQLYASTKSHTTAWRKQLPCPKQRSLQDVYRVSDLCLLFLDHEEILYITKIAWDQDCK